MAVHLDGVGDDGFDAIIVAHYLDGADDAKHWHVVATRRLREHFVIVACDDQRRYRVTWPDLDGAIMAAQNDRVTRLHDGHGHAMVRQINRIFI